VKTRRLWMVFFILSFSIACGAQSRTKQLGAVNGQTITEDEVNRAAARELEALELQKMQLEKEYERAKHAILERALNAVVEDRLLKLEAENRKISKEDLVQQEKDLKGLIARLKNQHQAISFLEPVRVEVASSGFPSRGPANAPVTIVEFSDFECPYCAGFFPTIKQIEQKYGNQVRIVYRQFPLNSIHPNAQKAAEASLCAQDQQRFWEYHDLLFADIRNLGVDALKAHAANLGLNLAAFNTCLDSGKQAAAVTADQNDGMRAGVTGTPALFINGRAVTGAQPFAQVASIIDDELKRSAAKR